MADTVDSFLGREVAEEDARAHLVMAVQRPPDAAKNPGRLLDRILHAYRRKKARRQLTGKQIHSVLFLCQGNAYRSPYAAAVFNGALAAMESEALINVASAGFTAPGRSSPERALVVAREHGIDLSTHRSTLVTPQAVSNADLVVVMSEDQERRVLSSYGRKVWLLNLGDLDPLPIQSRSITDPWGCEADVVDDVFSRIDRCVVQLAKMIAK